MSNSSWPTSSLTSHHITSFYLTCLAPNNVHMYRTAVPLQARSKLLELGDTSLPSIQPSQSYRDKAGYNRQSLSKSRKWTLRTRQSTTSSKYKLTTTPDIQPAVRSVVNASNQNLPGKNYRRGKVNEWPILHVQIVHLIRLVSHRCKKLINSAPSEKERFYYVYQLLDEVLSYVREHVKLFTNQRFYHTYKMMLSYNMKKLN